MRTLQSELDRIGGNIMAYYADQEMDRRHRAEILAMPNDSYCKNCAAEPGQKYDPVSKIWVVKKLMDNGLCNHCDADFKEQEAMNGEA